MVISWNEVHLCYDDEENVAFPDGAAEFGSGL